MADEETGVLDEEAVKDAESQRLETERVQADEERVRAEQEAIKRSEEARIRAEAERDLLQKAIAESRAANTGQTPQWGDAEWNAFTERTNITKDQVAIHASMAQQQINIVERKLEERIQAAEKKAQEAEARAVRFEKNNSIEKEKKDYYARKPELARYDKDVEEFLSKFPEESKDTPEKLRDIISMAENYVRGKVGDKMRTSPKLSNESEDEVDTTGLDDVEARNFRKIIPTREKMKIIEPLTSAHRHGIMIKSENEWDEADKVIRGKK